MYTTHWIGGCGSVLPGTQQKRRSYINCHPFHSDIRGDFIALRNEDDANAAGKIVAHLDKSDPMYDDCSN